MADQFHVAGIVGDGRSWLGIGRTSSLSLLLPPVTAATANLSGEQEPVGRATWRHWPCDVSTIAARRQGASDLLAPCHPPQQALPVCVAREEPLGDGAREAPHDYHSTAALAYGDWLSTAKLAAGDDMRQANPMPPCRRAAIVDTSHAQWPPSCATRPALARPDRLAVAAVTGGNSKDKEEVRPMPSHDLRLPTMPAT